MAEAYPSDNELLAITRKEVGSWGWAAFQFLVLTGLGYVVTFVVYQVGSLVL